MITTRQIEDLYLELLQNRQYSITRTSAGLEITQGNNKYVLPINATAKQTSQLRQR